MATWKPDPKFCPSPRRQREAPPEKLACVALLNPNGNGRPDSGVPADHSWRLMRRCFARRTACSSRECWRRSFARSWGCDGAGRQGGSRT